MMTHTMPPPPRTTQAQSSVREKERDEIRFFIWKLVLHVFMSASSPGLVLTNFPSTLLGRLAFSLESQGAYTYMVIYKALVELFNTATPAKQESIKLKAGQPQNAEPCELKT